MIATHRHSGARALHAMSCRASVVVVGAGDQLAPLLDLAAARITELELRWSRFLHDSEVSALNRHAGRALQVSADTVALVEAMVRGWHATERCYDPSLLAALVDLGYDASRQSPEAVTALSPRAERRGEPGAIGVDPEQRVVMLPAGTAIDPGGVGKGLAADIVVDELIEAGADGALVEIGGDLRVAGRAPVSEGWIVAVDTGAAVDSTIALQAGGVATSTSRRRTWRTGGVDRHHLIDPATLDPSDNGCTSCTVIAGTAAWAEVFTKVAFVRSLDEAIGTFDRHRLAASLTTEDGQRHLTTAWERFGQ
jgi:thiamine biosynthesis lipoprotein